MIDICLKKLADGLGLSAPEIAAIAPRQSRLGARAVRSRFSALDREGVLNRDQWGRLGNVNVYPAWAIRRYIFGDMSASPGGDPTDARVEDGQ